MQFRLFFAGLYPVEFRDFFLGDIYCSLTYATTVSRLHAFRGDLFFHRTLNSYHFVPECGIILLSLRQLLEGPSAM